MRELNLKMTRTQYAFESNAALRYAFSIFAVLAAVLVRILLRINLARNWPLLPSIRRSSWLR